VGNADCDLGILYLASDGKCEKVNRATQNMPLKKKETDQNPAPREMQTRNAYSRCREKRKTASEKQTPGEYYNMCSSQDDRCCYHGCDNRE
jgi:hypothetical protein